MTEGGDRSLADAHWPVRTERLLLRPATVADLEAAWEWRRAPEVSRWMTNPATDRDAYLERLSEPDRLAAIVAVENDDRVIMDLHVRVQDSYAQTDVAQWARATKAVLGWSMDPAFHGRGLATEAVGAGLAICFDQVGLHRVQAECFAGNTPSWRLMERLGMRREAHLREEGLHRDVGWTDTYVYAILASEWFASAHAGGGFS